MKNPSVLLFSLLVFFTTILNAQVENLDLVYLKNGSVLKGKIIEYSDTTGVKIKLNEKTLVFFEWSQIDKVDRSHSVVNIFQSNKKNSGDILKIFPDNEKKAISSFGIGLTAGYGFDFHPEQIFSYEYTTESGVRKYRRIDQQSYSRGSGVYFTIAMQYSLTDAWACEVGVSAMVSDVITYTSYDYITTQYTKYSESSSIVTITPALKYSLPKISKYAHPFFKVGAILGIPSVTVDVEERTATMNRKTRTEEYSKSLIFGFQLAAGLEYEIGHWNFVSMVTLNEISYSPDSKTISNATINGGVDPSLLNSQEIKLVENYDESQPNTAPARKMEFGSIGIMFGFRYNF
ncbi:MAG: hypothetical protein LWX56_14405 [Ignavibacteria bacterium]|nr:hypothetical protein [Ignavibacteria bacterium]